jgi:hypothetical protein
MLNKDP